MVLLHVLNALTVLLSALQDQSFVNACFSEMLSSDPPSLHALIWHALHLNNRIITAEMIFKRRLYGMSSPP